MMQDDGKQSYSFIKQMMQRQLPADKNAKDDIPLADLNIAQMGKDLWVELLNDANGQDPIANFHECIIS